MTDEELRAYIAKRVERMKEHPNVVIKTQTVTFRPSEDAEKWRAKALTDLQDWMLASSQPSVTIETWAAVYIRCGRCLTEWRQWCEENPVGNDLPGWLEAAQRIVTEKRWI
jgi:hypothetical protein